jgi:hypothetical protein
MILIASLLLRPWLRRVTYAPLAERVYRTETLFWLVVTAAGIVILTAALLQMTLPPPPPLAGRPPAAGRA